MQEAECKPKPGATTQLSDADFHLAICSCAFKLQQSMELMGDGWLARQNMAIPWALVLILTYYDQNLGGPYNL